ncbi:UxaA family hydrolase [Parendozoicomonas haliclonae]|uniref:Altronate dehydratase n=1 Tax=Parendozoicomonas haliclonae TaxID=1960125 RepID=A0A1X7AH23_9GAMM|nr:altronate dehydratase family protein [Parendozoicomonas haliclonae]SMA39561.1 Altronate dehydratase [Parendozoicomonas haliclonae]
MTTKQSIIIHKSDNVIVALGDLKAGEQITAQSGDAIALLEEIGRGHKIAAQNIEAGQAIIKYGLPIGHATTSIKAGEWVHTHNIKTSLEGAEEYSYEPSFPEFTVTSRERKINVYRRKSGEIGIRNELWVIPTVSCVNGITQKIVERFKKEVNPEDIDGVYALPHPYGCSQMGDDHETTKTILQNMVRHPNAGAVMVVGLGCENNQVAAFREGVDCENLRVDFMICQQEQDEIEAGVERLKALYESMRNDRREAASIGELKVGLECGGSDGLSGITANPLLGVFSDYLIHNGGTSVLTEVPEMFGAETLLMERCCNQEVFDKTVEMVNGFKDYFERHGQVVYENPSPGNKKGGISTLEDKSMGCTQKAGQSPVQDVLKYGEILKVPGLNLLEAPGNDAVATTALAAAGCHMVLFTTGRGTPYGGFVPTMKIATNSELAANKPNWIDFNAGRLIEDISMEDLHELFVDYLVDCVNGKQVRNEVNDFRELAIFKSGVTL